MEFRDENQTLNRHTRFLKRKRGKNIAPKRHWFCQKLLQNQGQRYFEETGGHSVFQAGQWVHQNQQCVIYCLHRS